MTVPVVKKKKQQSKWYDAPIIGKAGSIAFFVTLFALANKDSEGYEQFRKCHQNCVNGLLHFVGMPPAVAGVFMIVRAASDSPSFTRYLQFTVTSCYFYLYMTYETNKLSPFLFYVLYMAIWECLYHFLYKNKGLTRTQFLALGIFFIALNVGGLEVIGHGFFEHHHSYVSEFFNSVFHTPLYGVNSVLAAIQLYPHHTCW